MLRAEAKSQVFAKKEVSLMQSRLGHTRKKADKMMDGPINTN